MEYSKGRNWLITGCILAIAGVPVFGLAAYEYLNASPAMGWPTTIGMIEYSRVGSGVDASGRLGISSSYFPEVGYRYEVDGVSYSGNNVYLGIGSPFKKETAAVVAKYRPGQQTKVYYDPLQPDTAVLDPKVQGQNFVALYLSALASGMGVLCLSVFRTIRRKELWG
ncbi:DUF3592 domain-containing protein [Phragmitibacter flavus]|uniref:DUF3592 domain-containing protein n=1 Tax=Phragmitibacter flavus TaxID=2576071 RepID=UPI0014089BAE|nr:DUF3592 domain-containing protein [Phragmitibacter flavus]